MTTSVWYLIWIRKGIATVLVRILFPLKMKYVCGIKTHFLLHAKYIYCLYSISHSQKNTLSLDFSFCTMKTVINLFIARTQFLSMRKVNLPCKKPSEAHRVVRRRRSHTFYTIGPQMAVSLQALATVALYHWRKSSEIAGNLNRNFPACCIVLQPITLFLAPNLWYTFNKISCKILCRLTCFRSWKSRIRP
jgi:hypothetical protein